MPAIGTQDLGTIELGTPSTQSTVTATATGARATVSPGGASLLADSTLTATGVTATASPGTADLTIVDQTASALGTTELGTGLLGVAGKDSAATLTAEGVSATAEGKSAALLTATVFAATGVTATGTPGGATALTTTTMSARGASAVGESEWATLRFPTGELGTGMLGVGQIGVGPQDRVTVMYGGGGTATATGGTGYLLTPPYDVTATATGPTSVDLTWADPSNREEGFRVYRADERHPGRDTGFSDFKQIADLPPDTTSYTDDTPEPNHDYKYYIEVYTADGAAKSETVQTTTEVAYGPHWTIELRQGGEVVTVESEELLSVSAPVEHTVVNEWELEIPESPAVEDWTASEMFLWYDGQLVYRGEFEAARTQNGVTTLSGRDVTRKLQRGGAEESYSSTPVWKAVQDYWQTHTGFNATVHEPPTETFVEGETAQAADTESEWAEIVSPAEDVPVRVAGDGSLELLQTCFVKEGEDPDRKNDPSYWIGEDELSGANADGVYKGTSYLEYDFTPQYRIPAEHIGMSIRPVGTDNAADMTIRMKIQGSWYTLDWLSGGEGIVTSWRDFANNGYNGDGYTGSAEIPAGSTVTVRVQGDSDDGGDFGVDVIALHDNRFDYFFDNDNGGNGGYLDGPELYPHAASVTLDQFDNPYNVPSVSITSTWEDGETGGGQQLEVSNDQRDNWVAAANTTSLDVDFTTYGTTIDTRLTLSRYGTRDTATPQQGFKGQAVDAITITYTANDLAVIDDREYVGSHYENLQQLHKDGGMRFVIGYEDGGLPVESFTRGQVEKSAEWTTDGDPSRTVATEEYANSVTVWGSVDEETGERLKAVVKSEDAIEEDGEEIEAPPIFEEKIDSKVDLQSRALTELSSRLAADRLTGSVEIVPKRIQPGYSYSVPELDGETLSLERVVFREGVDQVQGTLEFEESTDLASRLSELSSEVKSVKDAF